MKRLTSEEVKHLEFEILKHIHEICVNNGLRYSLIGGTLIGAIRHKGFIPWDDDIDICLPWEDYIKLLGILQNDRKYELYYDMSSKGYSYWFAKLVDRETIAYETHQFKYNALGVWVDIFPLVGIPEAIQPADYLKELDYANRSVSDSIRYNYCYDANIIKRLIKVVVLLPRMIKAKLIGEKKLKDKREALYTKQDFETAQMVGIVPTVYGEGCIWRRQCFDEYVDVEFEGAQLKACKQWHEVLTTTYGNYMELPPVEKRVGDHFVVYRK